MSAKTVVGGDDFGFNVWGPWALGLVATAILPPKYKPLAPVAAALVWRWLR